MILPPVGPGCVLMGHPISGPLNITALNVSSFKLDLSLVKYCPVVEKGLSHWTDIGGMVFKASSNFFNRLGILTGLTRLT